MLTDFRKFIQILTTSVSGIEAFFLVFGKERKVNLCVTYSFTNFNLNHTLPNTSLFALNKMESSFKAGTPASDCTTTEKNR